MENRTLGMISYRPRVSTVYSIRFGFVCFYRHEREFMTACHAASPFGIFISFYFYSTFTSTSSSVCRVWLLFFYPNDPAASNLKVLCRSVDREMWCLSQSYGPQLPRPKPNTSWCRGDRFSSQSYPTIRRKSASTEWKDLLFISNTVF